MPIARLELAEDIVKALALARIETVGELMVRVLADEQHLGELLMANKAGADAMEAIQYALDDLVIPELLVGQEAAEEEAAPEAATVEAAAEARIAEPIAPEAVAVPPVEEEPDLEAEARPAFPDLAPEPEVAAKPKDKGRKPERPPVTVVTAPVAEEETLEEEEWDGTETEEEEGDERLSDKRSGRKKKKKVKKGAKQQQQRGVQLVFDEDLGEVVAKRRRKGTRRREDFDEVDFEDF
jgi:hypothetical protein